MTYVGACNLSKAALSTLDFSLGAYGSREIRRRICRRPSADWLSDAGAFVSLPHVRKSLHHRGADASKFDGLRLRVRAAKALQNVFYGLQTSERAGDWKEGVIQSEASCLCQAVSCMELMKSFGWDASDAFIQHDVQDTCRTLQRNIQ